MWRWCKTVCTLSKVTVGRHNYYTEVIAKDDYYREGGESRGRFFGKGAAALSLTHTDIEYKDKRLQNLFLGISPEGTVLRNVSLTEREYTLKGGEKVKALPNLGWDFTFSAPKTVSVLWSQAPLEVRVQIEACHRRAVTAAMMHLEKEGISTRSGRGGKVQERIDPIFAAFTHSTSRAQDPQIHDHVILLNTGLTKDGKGGAVDARVLFQTLHTLGAIYREELRNTLEIELGVRTVERTIGKAKGFEIHGVGESMTKEFSKRRTDIEGRILSLEKETGRKVTVKENQAITKESRPKKEIKSREDLFSMWQEKGKELGFDIQAVIPQKKKERPFTKRDGKEFIRNVSKRLSYRENITEKDVFYVSLSESKGRFSREHLTNFTKNYTLTFLLPVGQKDEKPSFTLNRFGREAACEKPLYDKIRKGLREIHYTVKRWLYAQKSKARTRREQAFKVRITFAYATGKINRQTYKRLFSKRIPETRVGIELLYATHQISTKQRDYYLRQIDPEVARKRESGDLRREKFAQTKEENLVKARELEEKGLISKRTVKEIEKGKESLMLVTRDLQRRGELTTSKEPTMSNDNTKESPSREETLVGGWVKDGFLPTRTLRDFTEGRVSFETLEKDLNRRGLLEKEKKEVTPQQPKESQTKEMKAKEVEPKEKEIELER